MADVKVDKRTATEVATEAKVRVGFGWRPAILASLIAGVIMKVVEMALVYLVNGQNPLVTLQVPAALVMGQEVLPPPATANAAVLASGVAVHLVLALVLGIIGLAIFRPLHPLTATIGMGIYGLLAYVVFYFLVSPFTSPWLADYRTWVTLFSFLVYGVSLGVFYLWISRQRVTVSRGTVPV